MKKIFIIGAGNVATHIGIGLQKSGNHIIGVYSKSLGNARQLGEKLYCPYTSELSSISTEADIYILAIKDDALSTDLDLKFMGNKIFLHTSGSINMNVLSKYSDNYGVIYPLFTFTKENSVTWDEIPICLEASNEFVKQEIDQLSTSLSDKIYYLTSQQRSALHLAAVWVNNFSNHLLSIADDICKENNIPFDILEPIAYETIRKAFILGPETAQTGPAIRGDRKTIENHLKLIGDNELLNTLYIYLSKSVRSKIS